MKERPALIRLLVRPLEVFFKTEALGGTVLIIATAVALIWANSAYAESYLALWSTELTIGVPRFSLSKPLSVWVNDLLMAVFFLVVGLEIKRELVVGELSTVRKALLPVIAAVGGMIVPALVFLAIAREDTAARGWGTPMATDIAFALGCLRLLGSRIPSGLVVMLTALAIIDDLGAIVVIAAFYSGSVSIIALAVAAACVVALAVMNVAGVRRSALYLLVGAPLWLAILKSGIHPTIAGVIVGFAVPARALYSRGDVIDQARELLEYARMQKGQELDEALGALENRLDQAESPLSRLEHALHPWVAFAIVPIFAIANAGVSFTGVEASDLVRPVSLGVLLGLFLGKQSGVFLATLVAVKLKLAVLPAGVGWRHVYGLSLLAGIGFTMSLFIAGLAYGEGTEEHIQAKLGILAASALSAFAGLAVLLRSKGVRE